MKIKLAQLNPVVGDIEGNVKRLKEVVSNTEPNLDLLIFSELFLTGYPPRDLLLKSWFIKKVEAAIDELKEFTENLDFGILLGSPVPTKKDIGRGLYNSALLFYKGKLIFQQNKSLKKIGFLMQ